VPKDRVIGTDPSVDTEVIGGSPIKLLMSKGPNTVEVPNVVGLTTEKALAQIEALELTANIQQSDSDAPSGDVVTQTPSAGVKLKKGKQVTIFVSSGTLQVPDVVGEPKALAIKNLKKAGLKPVVRTDTSAPPEQAGLVTNQFPIGGSTATRGSTVQISVGQPAAPTP
jgi:eukaryotic-like serine/threonine-protein kinase